MRVAFWVAILFVVLFIAAAMKAPPTASLLYAAAFIAVAWGIHLGSRWAAVAGAWIIFLPLAGMAVNAAERRNLYVSGPIHLAVAAVFLWAASRPATRSARLSRAWPWMLLTGGATAAAVYALVT